MEKIKTKHINLFTQLIIYYLSIFLHNTFVKTYIFYKYLKLVHKNIVFLKSLQYSTKYISFRRLFKSMLIWTDLHKMSIMRSAIYYSGPFGFNVEEEEK